MSNYTKEIMDLIKKNFENITDKHDFQSTSEARSYYLKNLDDNLYMPMSV